MPFLAIFRAAAQVGLGVDAAVFKPYEAVGREGGGKRDVEAAVAIEVDGIFAVALDSFLVGEEHRYFRAVGRGIEHLFGHIVVGVEVCHFRTCHHAALAGCLVVGEGCRGVEERGEAVENLVGFRRRRDAGRAEGG